MNNQSYDLNQLSASAPEKKSTIAVLRKLFALIAEEKGKLYLACLFIIINALINLSGPLLVGYAIDHYVQHKEYHGLLVISGFLLAMYLVGFCTSYVQTRLMGGVGQRLLFQLRNAVFRKLQELPVAFFNQNKAGDLISRINNDTDKLNQFFSQSLMQFVGSLIIMIGAGIFLLSIHIELGSAALAPALLIVVFTKLASPWVKRTNALNLKSVGGMSAEIQESLNNFKVIIAFNRRDYFRERFEQVNTQNYTTAMKAGVANNIFMPVYGLSANLGQVVVLVMGIYLIATGSFTVGLLISFLAYVNNFYNPLRQLAALWANFQVAMAGWDRISQLLALESNLETVQDNSFPVQPALLEFKDVSFGYPNGKPVLHHISFTLERGKTYAFVGPTGGGKTTTASLIARLYDPTEGKIMLEGKDIRSYDATTRATTIGFILQEPFLFSGTVRENILYGNEQYLDYTNEQLVQVVHDAGLEALLARFDNGLDTTVSNSGDSISLGQKQLLAFMRAVLRNPSLLILDEATANIDTVTEQLLEDILRRLPATTTRVIIAHRLNTIESADEIFFINAGEVNRAGSLQDAMHMLLQEKRQS
ncbi:ABC transporter ATP-binding protein [Deminuibacter soli]|uniref:ABC transporter ATP-binding protein n=1 Tax=Deminuibacter soli TaxID=2291815 RepID=A0A3E1NHL1_9BACT|nr:ABC transporter ATP-binding protein [Deminuibacter soli]RFM27372.1 ABC transporter ATP-binding protein [Deminuibacter soli]